ncbi:MAG: nuoC [Acidimicrobiaceae bacterium]|nr:nuoC [Acidimicrobiaceae bacterium]
MSTESPAAVEETPAAQQPAFSAGIPGLAGIPVTLQRGQEVLYPDLGAYVDAVTSCKDAGFITCADLTAVDYLRHLDRALPAGVVAERFELVVVLLSHEHGRRLRLRVQVSEQEPVCPSLFTIYPGTENMEREVYDMFGIRFSGHPDLTRILMPEDWEGHPLRKDYGVGRVPVQFKDAPGPR